MSDWGQTRKYSLGADVVRSSPNNRHEATGRLKSNGIYISPPEIRTTLAATGLTIRFSWTGGDIGQSRPPFWKAVADLNPEAAFSCRAGGLAARP
jgi:hypothetical protein